ncbi:hypothetical protein LTR85_010678 [Meristemomyces frigidus]|nr:hypothetical protein LTR85_010678 [Meristemomyces frigidus]
MKLVFGAGAFALVNAGLAQASTHRVATAPTIVPSGTVQTTIGMTSETVLSVYDSAGKHILARKKRPKDTATWMMPHITNTPPMDANGHRWPHSRPVTPADEVSVCDLHGWESEARVSRWFCLHKNMCDGGGQEVLTGCTLPSRYYKRQIAKPTVSFDAFPARQSEEFGPRSLLDGKEPAVGDVRLASNPVLLDGSGQNGSVSEMTPISDASICDLVGDGGEGLRILYWFKWYCEHRGWCVDAGLGIMKGCSLTPWTRPETTLATTTKAV